MVHTLRSGSDKAQVIRILQNIIQNNYLRVGLESKDGEFLTSENILMVSPFIRSVLNSLQSVSETVLILPDFSRAEVEKCLNLLEYKAGEDLVFSGTTKRLLETIGVDLKNIKPLERNVKPKVEDNPALRINIKAEMVEDNDSDKMNKLLADSDREDNLPGNMDEIAGGKEDDNEDNMEQDFSGNINDEPQSYFRENIENKDTSSDSVTDEIEQRKLQQEVEELLEKEDGVWDCRYCGYKSKEK